jgi:hypothetical protein
LVKSKKLILVFSIFERCSPFNRSIPAPMVYDQYSGTIYIWSQSPILHSSIKKETCLMSHIITQAIYSAG